MYYTKTMKIKSIFTLTLFVFIVSITNAQHVNKRKFSHENGTFVDERDGRKYKTITFKKMHHGREIVRTWFAENVQYDVEGSYAYNDTEEYASRYGRLYNYKQANEACPTGWHVPTIAEWKYLFDFFGGWHHSGKFLIEGKESDMHMLYGGFGEPGHLFKGIGVSGNWWDNELKDSNTAGIITLKVGDGTIYHSKVGDQHMLSSRCVKYHN